MSATTARHVAEEALLALGCAPDAIHAAKEPATTVWLLAARFAADYSAEIDHCQWYHGWAGYFGVPENRVRGPSLFDIEDSDDVLKTWLDYARGRRDKVAMRLLTSTLCEALSDRKMQGRVRKMAQ